jgi:hypothetical protein
LLCSGVTLAQESPIVRVEVSQPSVAVGESTEIRVTVLVPTWFPQPPVFPDFELVNAITRRPANSSRPTSERIDRATWSGIVRVYRVYPLTGATYRISGESIDVTWANPGAEPFRQNIAIPDVELRATVPVGAEGLNPYLAGTRVSLSIEPEGGIDGLEAGDAVALRYTAELEGLPAIFLPPLAPELDIDGVSVYAAAPELSDGPPARRSEKITLVFDAGGEFALPRVSIDYWNTDSGSIETVSADGLSLTVAGPPAESAGDAAQPAPFAWRRIALPAAFAVVLGAFLRRRLPGWRASRARARKQREASEEHAFRELLAALRAGREEAAYRWLLKWTDRLELRLDSENFAREYGDEALQVRLRQWRAGLFAGRSANCDLTAIAAGLAQARQRCLAQIQPATRGSLPPLNPT